MFTFEEVKITVKAKVCLLHNYHILTDAVILQISNDGNDDVYCCYYLHSCNCQHFLPFYSNTKQYYANESH